MDSFSSACKTCSRSILKNRYPVPVPLSLYLLPYASLSFQVELEKQLHSLSLLSCFLNALINPMLSVSGCFPPICSPESCQTFRLPDSEHSFEFFSFFSFCLSGIFDSMTFSCFNWPVFSHSLQFCRYYILHILSLNLVISSYGFCEPTYTVVTASSVSLSLIYSHKQVDLLSYLITNPSFLCTFYL